MKRVLKHFFKAGILAASILFFGCDLINFNFSEDDSDSKKDFAYGEAGNFYDQSKSYYVGDEAVFYCRVDDSEKVYSKVFRLVSSGSNCNVWRIVNDSGYMQSQNITQSTFKSLAYNFDKLYGKEINIFGSNKFTSKEFKERKSENGSVDAFITSSPEKINIIVYDICGDASKDQKSGTYGYFFTGDMYKKDVFKASNATEMFYIDSYFLKIDEKAMYSTLFHEFQHMLHFVNKVMKGGNEYSTETWFSEMRSLVCEDILFEDLDIDLMDGPYSRLNLFNSHHSLGVKEWRKTSEYVSYGDVFVSYANSYAFGAYLLRNYGGVSLFKEIASNEYNEPEACLNAAFEALELSVDFEDVLSDFYQVLLNTEEPDSYSDVISLNKGFEDELGNYTYKIINIDLNDVPNHNTSRPVINYSANSLTLPIGAYGFEINKTGSDFNLSNFSAQESGITTIKHQDEEGDYYLIRINNTEFQIEKNNAGELKGFRSLLSEISDGLSQRALYTAEPVIGPSRIDYYEDPAKIRKMIAEINEKQEALNNED